MLHKIIFKHKPMVVKSFLAFVIVIRFPTIIQSLKKPREIETIHMLQYEKVIFKFKQLFWLHTLRKAMMSKVRFL